MFPLSSLNEQENQFIYGLDVNGVHFCTFSIGIFMQRETNSKIQIDQLESKIYLLEKDLIKANQNRHLVPWIVVLLTEKSSFSNSSLLNIYLEKLVFFVFNQLLKILNNFSSRVEMLFYEYNVDLIMESSKANVYERSYPVLKMLNLKYEPSYSKPEKPIRISMPKNAINYRSNFEAALNCKLY